MVAALVKLCSVIWTLLDLFIDRANKKDVAGRLRRGKLWLGAYRATQEDFKMDLRELVRRLQMLEQLLDSQGRDSVEVVIPNIDVIDIVLEDDGSGLDNLVVIIKEK